MGLGTCAGGLEVALDKVQIVGDLVENLEVVLDLALVVEDSVVVQGLALVLEG